MFTLAFWKNALEHAVVGASAGFLAVLPTNVTSIDWVELKAAAIGAGAGALYAFVKQVGAVQLANNVSKVSTARHARPTTGGPQ